MQGPLRSKDMVRIPGELSNIYRKVMCTEEGRSSTKRIRVSCGICNYVKYYSITRGITRISSVIACESCRHFYQLIKRSPSYLDCNQEVKGSCFKNQTFIDTHCKACLCIQILEHCPLPQEIYSLLSSYLSDECKQLIRGEPLKFEDVSSEDKGSLKLFIWKDNEFVEVNEEDELPYTFKDADVIADGDGDIDIDEYNEEESMSKKDDAVTTDEDKDNFNTNVNISEEFVQPALEEILDSQIKISHVETDSTFNEMEGYSLSTKANEKSDKESSNGVESGVERRPGLPRASKEKVSFNLEREEEEDVDDPDEEVSSSPDVDEETEESNALRPSIDTVEGNVVSDDLEFDPSEEALVDDPSYVEKAPKPKAERAVRAKSSARIKEKAQKIDYFKPKTGKKNKGGIYDSEGRLTKSGKDLCDCLHGECQGCHFPCPKCRSTKCGSECRVNRRWYFERIEIEGTKVFWTNKYLRKT